LVCIDNASHDGGGPILPRPGIDLDRLARSDRRRALRPRGSCRDLSPSLRALHCPRVRRRGPSLGVVRRVANRIADRLTATWRRLASSPLTIAKRAHQARRCGGVRWCTTSATTSRITRPNHLNMCQGAGFVESSQEQQIFNEAPHLAPEAPMR